MTTPKHLQTAAAQQKADASVIDYVPYGSQDKIKLSVEIVRNLIANRTKTGVACTNRDALKFIAMCQAKRLNPFEGDAFLVGYDGKNGPVFSLITAHQAFLKRAELHPEFDGMESGVLVMTEGVVSAIEGDFHLSSQELVGGWATVFFKTRKHPMHKRARLDRFDKGTDFWEKNPEGLIVKCMEADALRSAFPTMCGGLYLKEEIELIPPMTGAYQIDVGTTTEAPQNQLPEGTDDADYIPKDKEPEKAPAAATGSEAAQSAKTLAPGKLKSASELPTIVAQFQAFLDEIKCPLGKFAAWAEIDGHVADATSMGSLEEFPGDVLKRLLKYGRSGMTEALTPRLI